MQLRFHAIADQAGGWQTLFERLWPAYRRWYLSEGVTARPTYAECRRALQQHMPEFVPDWERLVELAGGGDLAARFLSLYGPPAYLGACSQAIWPGAEPLLVRNYDYTPRAFDAVCLHTRWAGRAVMGTSDCLIGMVDGLNDAGLALSLTFGGRRDVGPGFGVPMILRYVLQTCDTTVEAALALARLPSHMAYNVTVVDARREIRTAHLAPGTATVISRSPVATNHQSRLDSAGQVHVTTTVERERYLLQRLMLHEDAPEQFVGHFLRPPLYSLAFDRGFGTLFTAAYRPLQRRLTYHWPHYQWDLLLDDFTPGARNVSYPVARPSPLSAH